MPEKYLFEMSNDRSNLFGIIPGRVDPVIPGQNQAESGFKLPAAAEGNAPSASETKRQQPLVAGGASTPPANTPLPTLEQDFPRRALHPDFRQAVDAEMNAYV